MTTSKPILKFSSILAIFASLFIAFGSVAVGYAATMAANGGMITGSVSSPGGYPLPDGTLVKLFDSDVENIKGMAVPDPNDGSFQIGPVPNGLYVLKAVPPMGSSYTQSLPKAVSIVNTPVDVGDLALTEPQITGSVVAPDGVTLVESDVFVYLGDGQILQHVTALEGEFLIGGLPVGGYGLRAFPTGDDPYWKSGVEEIMIESPSTEISVTLGLTEAQVWGYIHDDQGNPIPTAKVIITNQDGGEKHSDLSNANGYWAIGNLVSGSYQLTALPPWSHSGLLSPEPVEVSLPGAINPYNLAFLSPPKFVTGTVQTNTNQPVFHAQVTARRVNLPGNVQTLSEADGSYQLDLPPGLWGLTIQPITSTVPLDWVYPYPPQFVYFHWNNQLEERQQDFTVIVSDATVNGFVEMPDSSIPTFTVTVGLHNDEGIGVQTNIDLEDGSFELSIPNGAYKVSVHPDHDGYLAPSIDPINVPINGNYDLGVLTLLQRDAVISGTVSTEAGSVSEIPIVAWRSGIAGSLQTSSGPDGVYALAVSEGEWHIQPAPAHDQPYLYSGSGQEIEIEAGGLVPDIDFVLLSADATIHGVLEDESGTLLNDVHGWAKAWQVGTPDIHKGAPIENGDFSIHIPAGIYHVAAYLPAGAQYTSSAEKQVTVSAGEIAEIRLTVQEKNARINGGLWDPRNQNVVEGVDGLVGAWWGLNWVAAPINSGNGTYSMDVAAGLWHLNFRIDPEAGYAKINAPLNVPVQENATVTVPLRIVPKDGSISGTVLDPDGLPLPGAKVKVKGTGLYVHDLWLETLSEADGSFSLDVPYGMYRLGAAFLNPDWIKPLEREIEVTEGGSSEGNILQFQESDLTLSGTLTVSNSTLEGDVHVWAWSEEGGFTQGQFPVTAEGSDASGDYQLGLLSNSDWHLGAVFETESQYWFGQAQISTQEDDISQDIILEGPHPKPAPIVVTFDASDPQYIELSDGTFIYVPAGAMPVSGEVTLRVVPIATLPHQQHASVLKYGYSFLATDSNGEPIETHFNQDVVITFTYEDEELIQQHIHEQWLKPAYFSTTTDSWTFPQSYVVDTQANQVVMQIDHFTDFALTSLTGYSLYLPITVR